MTTPTADAPRRMTAGFLDLVDDARAGDATSVGMLLHQYRNYLNVLASAQLEPRLRRRASPSDIVQEVMLRAHKDFEQFRGATEAELLGWLRQILINSLATFVERHVMAARRDVRREVTAEQLRNSIDQSTVQLAAMIPSRDASPSREAERHEEAVLLADRLARLPADYREVLVLRNLQGLSFDEIADQMGRTQSATRMLWVRAVDKLRSTIRREER